MAMFRHGAHRYSCTGRAGSSLRDSPRLIHVHAGSMTLFLERGGLPISFAFFGRVIAQGRRMGLDAG